MPESQIKIAQNVRNMLDDAKKRVLTFYSKEDFDNYLKLLNNARLAKTSDFGTCKRQLVDMFKARDIEGYEEILEESFDANSKYGDNKVKSILEKVPTRAEIISQLVQEMYELYSQFPSAQNYMEQIVCYLTGNNSNEPLRLKILKQFLRNTNYRTDYIVKTVEKKLTPTERQKYDKHISSDAKRVIILANIDDSIFEKENHLSFSEWQEFFSNWLKRINMSPFNVTVNFVPDKNATTEEIENQFYNYLNDNYKLVSDDEKQSELGEVYKEKKIDFVKENARLLKIISTEKIISWNLKAYSKWIIQWIDKQVSEENLINSKTKKNLLKFAKDTGVIKENEIFDVLTLLKKISETDENVSSSQNRCELLKTIEEEIIKSCEIDTDIFNKTKLKWILCKYPKEIDAELKEKFLGNFGLSNEIYSQFLKNQIETININPLKISDELREKIKTALPEIAKLTDADLILKLATVPNFVFTKEEETKLISELIKATSNYLKQINILKDNKYKNLGQIFEQAVKDKLKLKNRDAELLKISQKLADVDFNPQDKKYLYLFAFAFDMEYGGAVKERNIENLFEKIFSANSFKNFVASNSYNLNCEGINIKNYVEVSYLWWLNQKKIPTAERLEKAEKFIDKCFKTAKNNKILIPSMSTLFYKDNIAQILKQAETDFQSFLLRNYRIYSSDPAENNNRILMAPLQNTARKKFIELAKKIRESSDLIPKVAPTIDRYGKIDVQGKKIYDADNEVEYSEVGIDELFDLIEKNPSTNSYPDDFIKLLKKLNETVQVGKRGLLYDEEKILEIEELLKNLIKTLQIDKNSIFEEERIKTIKKFLEKLEKILPFVKRNYFLNEEKILEIKEIFKKLLNEPLKIVEHKQNQNPKIKEIIKNLADTLKNVEKVLDENKILKDFTRTDLIALYYSYFTQSKLPDFQDDSTLGVVDWESLYNTFTEELDTYLTDCYFQPFNAKNLYDQFIFLSLMLEILQ